MNLRRKIMENFQVMEVIDVTFDEYKKWFDKYKNNNDIREINFQNEVIKKFICTIYPNLDVIDISRKGPESGIHNYFQYCGAYTDDNGTKKAVTPDLIIAQNWNWKNKENCVDYKATVEVKSPFLQPIYYTKYDEYAEDLKTEIRRHLSSLKNYRVILTDAVKWEFYDKKESGEKLIPIETFNLYDPPVREGAEWKIKIDEFEDLKKFLSDFLEQAINNDL
jgi:hypothetical protein